VDGIDTRWIPSTFLCGAVDVGFQNLLKTIIAMKFSLIMPGQLWIWNELCPDTHGVGMSYASTPND